MQLKRHSNGQLITLGTDLGGGGEGRIYTVLQDSSLVAKIYHANKLITETQESKLAAMLANPPDDPMASKGHTSIAWPVDLLWTVGEKQQIVGFLMLLVKEINPIINYYNPKERRHQCPLFSYLYLHRTARNLATAVHALHEYGYVIGDVNESNILVTDTALVTLVDTDSFQVPDPVNNLVYRCPVGKPGFTPPELQGKSFALLDRTPESDCFGLAVLIFQLLMEGTHPFDGEFTGVGESPFLEERIQAGHFPYGKKHVPYIPRRIAPAFEILHPTLRLLFYLCFEVGYDDPQARPNAQTWAIALEEAENALVTCSVNDQHLYGNHLSSCPWCERMAQLGGRDPFPSLQAVQHEEHLQPAAPVQTPIMKTAEVNTIIASRPVNQPIQLSVSPQLDSVVAGLTAIAKLIFHRQFLLGSGIAVILTAFGLNYVYPQWQGLQAINRAKAFKNAEKYEDCITESTIVDKDLKLLNNLHQMAQGLLQECRLGLNSDQLFLEDAKKNAASGDFVEAIQKASKIKGTENALVYKEAKKIINDSSDRIINLALEKYQKGDLQAAITEINVIPATTETTLIRQQNEEKTKQWKNDWQLAETEVNATQKAFQEGNWSETLEAYSKIPKIRFWQDKVEPIVQIARGHQFEFEVLKGERRVWDKSGIWEALPNWYQGQSVRTPKGPRAWKYVLYNNGNNAYWCWQVVQYGRSWNTGKYEYSYFTIPICDLKKRYGTDETSGNPVYKYADEKTEKCQLDESKTWSCPITGNASVNISIPPE